VSPRGGCPRRPPRPCVRYALEGSIRRAGNQFRVAESVAGAIEPRLRRAEIERVRRGFASMHEGSGEAIRVAHRLFVRATELDPTYALPVAPLRSRSA
jgi:hypothetical protein